MTSQCLSVCGPCAEICQGCIDADIKAKQDLERQTIDAAIRMLQSRGYKVTKTDPAYTQHVKDQIDQITHKLKEVPWGIQDQEALELERAVLTERRTRLLGEYNRLTLG